MRALSRNIAAPLALVLSAASPCQQGSSAKINGADFIDAQLLVASATGTDYDGMVGIGVDNSGHFWVTSRRSGPGTPHMLFEFDQNGAFVQGFAQPAGTSFSSWGMRDLALDETTNTLYGGLEPDPASGAATLYAFDATARRFDATRDVTIPNPGVTVVRALAFDATAGRFYVADFGSPIRTFDTAGTPGPVLPSVSLGVFGAAFDPAGDGGNGSIWLHSQLASLRNPRATNSARRMQVIEVDLTGVETGNTYTSDNLARSPNDFPFAGGACLQVLNNERLLVQLYQGNPTDGFVRTRVEALYGTTCGANIGYAGGHPYGGNQAFSVTGENLNEAVAFVLIGAVPGQVPLPGVTSCPLLIGSIATAAPMTVTGTSATFNLPIPTGVRANLYFQIIEVAPQLPFALSDGLKIAVIR